MAHQKTYKRTVADTQVTNPSGIYVIDCLGNNLSITKTRIVGTLHTDNGSCYRAVVHALACRALRIRHLRTQPYRPRTNGKAERFIQTALREWAYARAYGHAASYLRKLRQLAAQLPPQHSLASHEAFEAGLRDVGLSAPEVAAIMGGNWMDFFARSFTSRGRQQHCARVLEIRLDPRRSFLPKRYQARLVALAGGDAPTACRHAG